MENYIRSLSDSKAQSVLTKSISHKKPFYNFKEALCRFPEIREKWFEYHDRVMLEIAVELLEYEKLDYEFVRIR